jgi:hypothetical protein
MYVHTYVESRKYVYICIMNKNKCKWKSASNCATSKFSEIERSCTIISILSYNFIFILKHLFFSISHDDNACQVPTIGLQCKKT